MAKYNLNMSIDHCPNWGFWEAIREILQNGDDEQVENPLNTFTVKYFKDKNKLVLFNKESVLEKKTLIIGHSTKRDNKNTIGKYGEGYKVSFAVLARLGKPVVVKNFKNKEKWTIIVEDDVVKVDVTKYIFKSVPDNNLTWEISGVTEEEWNSIQTFYLPFMNDLDVVETEYGKLIKNENLKGNIYINNLFIEKNKEISAAYSLISGSVDLDRDRKGVNWFDLKYQIGKILTASEKVSENSLDYVTKLLEKDSPESDFVVSLAKENILNKVKENFELNNSENAYPVSSQSEYDMIDTIYSDLKPVIVTQQVYKCLMRTEKYSSPEKVLEKVNGNELKTELIAEPYKVLMDFYQEHARYMNDIMKNDFLTVVKNSKNWKINEIEKESEFFDEEIADDMKSEKNLILEENKDLIE